MNEGQKRAKHETSPNKPADHSRRELIQLKWLSTLVPGAAVLVYETVRYETLEQQCTAKSRLDPKEIA